MYSWRTVADALLAWEEAHGRDFPWRAHSGFPLAVAEILLQKTKAADAAPVWQEVMSRYPSASDLAAADPDSLQMTVSSLGLGRQRTHRLLKMSEAWDDSSYASLPGLGHYGIGILELAAGRLPEQAPVDGNLARVITRVSGWMWNSGEPRKKSEVRRAVKCLLSAADPHRRLSLIYALVDLGGIVCTPQAPSCPSCPLSHGCASAYDNATP